MTDKVDLVGIDTQYDCDVGGVFRKHTQVISDDFLTGLKEQRNASKDQREGDPNRREVRAEDPLRRLVLDQTHLAKRAHANQHVLLQVLAPCFWAG